MKRWSRLRNRFLKILENRMLHTQQKNFCVSLLRRPKSGIMQILRKRKSLEINSFQGSETFIFR